MDRFRRLVPMLGVVFAGALAMACAAPAGGDEGGETASAMSGGDTADASIALAKKAGCTACHAVDKKVVGPAFRDIADRYASRAGAQQKLSDAVRNGSSRSWGSVPMPPTTPREASAEEVDQLVQWILSLHVEVPVKSPTSSPPLEKTGPDLASDNGCFACHAVDKKIVGPSFEDVARKYAGSSSSNELLADKIRRGGSGVWGAVPMPPSADDATDAELDTIVSWILSL